MDLLEHIKALADPTRLRLTALLSRHELCVVEIVAVMGMGQPRISRHLKILADAGLLAARRDGAWVFYKASAEGAGADFLAATAPLFAAEPSFALDLTRAEEVVAERGRATTRLFNELAPGWNRLIREILGGLDLAAAIAAVVPPSKSAADLGCGAGALLPLLLTKAETVIGVDGSEKMLTEAARRVNGRPVSLRMGKIEHLPLRDAEVETAVMSLVLHHLPDPAAGLAEARRVLAPGGTLVVADFLKHENETLRTRMGDRWLGFDPTRIAAWLEKAGFALTKTQTLAANNAMEVGLYVATKPAQGEHDAQDPAA